MPDIEIDLSGYFSKLQEKYRHWYKLKEIKFVEGMEKKVGFI